MTKEDLVVPDPTPKDALHLTQALTLYIPLIQRMGAPREEAEQAAELQRRTMLANKELLREAYLDLSDSENLLIDPKTHSEFLDELELIVVNGELKDARKTILYEEGDEEA